MPVLRTQASNRREEIVQTILNTSGAFTFREYEGGTFAKLDWWIYKDGSRVGVAEFKGRTCSSDKYPTVFMAERKYVHLMEAANQESLVPLMIYGYSDGAIRGIDVREVQPDWKSTVVRVKRRGSGHVGANDTETAYEIPTRKLKHFGIITGDLLTEYNSLGVDL